MMQNTVKIIIFFQNTIIMALSRFLKRHQPPPRDDAQLEHLDMLSACRYLRKVGLKVQDVPMKLGINRIIHFLTQTAVRCTTENSYIQALYPEKEREEKEVPSTTAKHLENKQNLTDMNDPASFVNIETSRSFASQVSVNADRTFPFTPSPHKIFNLKQVVTKNSIEQQPPRHVRFVSAVRSQVEDEQRDQMLQRLQHQNRGLQRCLKNLFNFFQENNLISFQEGQWGRYEDIADQLTSNFIDYTQEIKEKMTNISAKSSLLQGTLHNMSISMRIDKENNTKEVQTEQEEEGISEQQLRNELAAAIEASKRAELLLYLKQEEISQLNVIMSDLQNKLKASSQHSQTKSRSKSYKKYFQVTGQDLSKTVR